MKAIGPILPVSQAFLAPLSGVTDVIMRRIAMRYGAGLVVSEMVASEEFVSGQEEARLRAEATGLAPHVVQIAGCAPRWMAEAATLAEASGAQMIDINMGCPAKRVTGGWAGSALMLDLDHATTLIAAVVGAVKCPVSVKMRLGWDERTFNAPELARRAEGEGAALVTVHGRTRQQFYKGRADWPAIARIREAVAVPLVANGDITTVADARACLAQARADYVMIGRAALGRPWLVGDIGSALAGTTRSEPPMAERHAVAVEHYTGLLDLMGREAGLRHARKHLAAYVGEAVPGDDRFAARRVAMLTTDDPAFALRCLADLFAMAAAREKTERNGTIGELAA